MSKDGGVFSFGAAAPFYGCLPGDGINSAVVGGGSSPNSPGCYLEAADGTVYGLGPGAPF